MYSIHGALALPIYSTMSAVVDNSVFTGALKRDQTNNFIVSHMFVHQFRYKR